jgi:hypothetical protein
MRHSLLFLVLALVIAAGVRNAAASVVVLPRDECPSSDAIASRLEHLGALDLLAQLGAAEVRVEAPSLRLSFRDRRGDPLGARVVTATSDCEARAALAAAVIAAFVGEWTQTALAPAPEKATAKAETGASPGKRWQADLGALIAAVHDGDEGGYGLGVRADLGHGLWLLSALVENSSERARTLGAGQGAYRFLRASIGLGVRTLGPHVFWDATLLPMIDRLSLAGKELAANRTVTRWGFVVAGQTRLGWSGGRLRPFLFLAASYRIPGERMTLENRPGVKVPLSATNVEAGVGISLRIFP